MLLKTCVILTVWAHSCLISEDRGYPHLKASLLGFLTFPKEKAAACLNSCPATPRIMNTILLLRSKAPIYNKHTKIWTHQTCCEGKKNIPKKRYKNIFKSVWVEIDFSEVSRKEGLELDWEPWAIPPTLCSSMDSIHWRLCSGSSARRYQTLSFTLMSKRHSSNSWGCRGGGEHTRRQTEHPSARCICGVNKRRRAKGSPRASNNGFHLPQKNKRL